MIAVYVKNETYKSLEGKKSLSENYKRTFMKRIYTNEKIYWIKQS